MQTYAHTAFAQTQKWMRPSDMDSYCNSAGDATIIIELHKEK